VSDRISVLVIREKDSFSETLLSAGLEVTNLPLIKTEPLDDHSELRSVIGRIDEYDGLLFTSPVAAQIFQEQLTDGTEYKGKIFVLGTRSKEVFDLAGSIVEFDPSASSAEQLIDKFANDMYGKKLLFVRGDRSLHTIPNLLEGRSLVDEVVVYRTIEVRPTGSEISFINQRLIDGKYSWTCFFSPSAVDSLFGLFGSGFATCAATIGHTTARRAAETGFDVGFVSPIANGREFAKAFLSHLNGTRS
jgi:uroporphyrinogen-III synthase